MSEPEQWRQGSDEAERDEKNDLLAEYYSGSLPHPSIIEGYEAVLPGSADRILTMAEAQMAHRQRMEQQDLDHIHRYQKQQLDQLAEEQERNTKFGKHIFFLLIFVGLVMGLAVIFTSTYLLYLNRDIEGLAVLIFGIATLVWGGIRGVGKIIEYGRQVQQREVEQAAQKPRS